MVDLATTLVRSGPLCPRHNLKHEDKNTQEGSP
jgi:hypothetical protein